MASRKKTTSPSKMRNPEDFAAVYAQSLAQHYGWHQNRSPTENARSVITEHLRTWARKNIPTVVDSPSNKVTGSNQPILLLVDDSLVLRQRLATVFKNELQCQVWEADNGMTAKSFLQNKLLPHLIICDIHMPQMDGIALMQYVRTHARTKHIPMLVLTADGSKETIYRARGLGVKQWLLKTSGLKNISDTVSALLKDVFTEANN